MIICELGFDIPDKNPNYSLREVDFYAFVPYPIQKEKGIENHRLSLRKNLKTGKFEVYRYYHYEEKEEVVFSGNFKEALKIANREREKVWGNRLNDIPCEHKEPNIDRVFCPKANK
jgi:hypothetical protein